MARVLKRDIQSACWADPEPRVRRMRWPGSLVRTCYRAPLSLLCPCRDVAAGASNQMDYVKPADVATSMIDAGIKKLALSPRDLLIRGALSGALLGAATTLAVTGAVTTGQPLVGALIFPVGLVMIVLL